MVREKKPQDKKKKKKNKGGPRKKAPAGPFDCAGFTNSDPPRIFHTLAEFWAAFPSDGWYPSGASYWERTSRDDSGMLGGLLELQEPDERSSRELVAALQAGGTGKRRACDVGGGIGRVTRTVLQPLFEQVDLVEQCPAFLQQAEREMPKVGRVCVGLQDFVPEEGSYDVVWVQWVTGHLRDEHFGIFVERMVRGLAEGGALVIKDNTSSGEEFVMDLQDHSVTRSRKHYDDLLKRAAAACGAILVSCTRQEGFPPAVFPVYTWLIQRAKSGNDKK